jgi:DNA processing protein
VSLSQAVVLVECPHKSGALLASAMAWQQGLPLWVVPADAARNSAAGSNRWLRQGATPLLEVQDLISQIGMGPLQASGMQQTADKPSAETTKEGALMEALEEGASLEQLCLQLASPPAAVMEQLLALELNGRIRSEPGLWWRRC